MSSHGADVVCRTLWSWREPFGESARKPSPPSSAEEEEAIRPAAPQKDDETHDSCEAEHEPSEKTRRSRRGRRTRA